MESVIKWRTGEPKEDGWYLVSIKSKYLELQVDTDYWNAFFDGENFWSAYDEEDVIAWCPLSEIEPYKE